MDKLSSDLLRNIQFIIGAFLVYKEAFGRFSIRRKSIRKAGASYEEINKLVKEERLVLPISWRGDNSDFFKRRLSNGKTVLDYCDRIFIDDETHELGFHPNFDRQESFVYTLPEYHRDIEMYYAASHNSSAAFLMALSASLDNMLPHVQGCLTCKRTSKPLRDDLAGRIEFLFHGSEGYDDLESCAKEVIARRNNYVHNDAKATRSLKEICDKLKSPIMKPEIRALLSVRYARNATSTAIGVITHAYFVRNNGSKEAGDIRTIARHAYQLCEVDCFDLLTGFYKELSKETGDYKWSVNFYAAKKLSIEGLDASDRECLSELLDNVPPVYTFWWRAGLLSLLDDYSGVCNALLDCVKESTISKGELLYSVKTTPAFAGFVRSSHYSEFQKQLDSAA